MRWREGHGVHPGLHVHTSSVPPPGKLPRPVHCKFVSAFTRKAA